MDTLPWNDELEALIDRVFDLYGSTALDAAVCRAVAKAAKAGQPVDATRSQASTESDGVLVPPGVIEAALKDELRKLCLLQ